MQAGFDELPICPHLEYLCRSVALTTNQLLTPQTSQLQSVFVVRFVLPNLSFAEALRLRGMKTNQIQIQKYNNLAALRHV